MVENKKVGLKNEENWDLLEAIANDQIQQRDLQFLRSN